MHCRTGPLQQQRSRKKSFVGERLAEMDCGAGEGIKTAPRRSATLKSACSLSPLHPLSEPMPAAAGNNAAAETRRRRRISQARFSHVEVIEEVDLCAALTGNHIMHLDKLTGFRQFLPIPLLNTCRPHTLPSEDSYPGNFRSPLRRLRVPLLQNRR